MDANNNGGMPTVDTRCSQAPPDSYEEEVMEYFAELNAARRSQGIPRPGECDDEPRDPRTSLWWWLWQASHIPRRIRQRFLK